MDQLSSRSTESSGVDAFAFRLWGRFAARRVADGADVTPHGRTARAVLAYLLIERATVPQKRHHRICDAKYARIGRGWRDLIG